MFEKNEEMVSLIRGQVGSNGKEGWPVAVRDRVAFPKSTELKVTDANVAVTFLWTMRDAVLPNLEKENLALATNFYTPAGLQGMIRNILGNPFIKYIIMMGEEYSSKAEGDKISELTSANAIRAFFAKGVNDDRKMEGFESAVYFDKNIPLELLEEIRKNVELIDLNKTMPNAGLNEKIQEANRLIKTLERKEPFLDRPQIFDYESVEESFPYEGGPIIVHGNNIPDAWIKMVYNINRYGRKNLMNANTDRWVKEINNMVVVIHNPQDRDLSVNPFLVPLTIEKIEAYEKEILSPLLPEGKAYTYGNELRAYDYPSAKEIKELVNSQEYKDFEFGQGNWLDKNVSYKEDYCEINQIEDIIDVLKRDPYSKACVAITWHPSKELMRKHKSSPCLVFLQAIIQDEKLNLTIFFRSHEMIQGWPENAYGCAAIQEEIAKAVGIEPGILTIISGSAHIYNNYYQQVEEMLSKYNSILNCNDSRGNYQIKIQGDEIILALLHPETGKILEEIKGKSAYEIKDKISLHGLETGHAIYIGTELAMAEMAIKDGLNYEQDETIGKPKMKDTFTPNKILGEEVCVRPNWDEFFMGAALLAASRASCKYLHTGATIARDKRILSTGYNGAPPGITNCIDIGCRKEREGIGFEEKGKAVCRGIHAEINALSQIARQDLKGAQMYTIYLPCSACAKAIAGSGINEVIYLKMYDEPDSLTREIFAESGIKLRKLDINFDKIFNKNLMFYDK